MLGGNGRKMHKNNHEQYFENNFFCTTIFLPNIGTNGEKRKGEKRINNKKEEQEKEESSRNTPTKKSYYGVTVIFLGREW